MSKPTVFISYSHLDEEWKDRLVRHLAVSQKQGHLELWHDRLIGAGEDWERQIQAAMDAASVAILLVSANSLTSDFILREEVSRLLERRASEGLRIFPVVIKPCDWGAVDWLRRMNLRPKDGKPLSSGNEHEIDLALAEIAREVRTLLSQTASSQTGQTRQTGSSRFVPLDPEKISISRLPVTGSHLFGRDDELKLLDEAWADLHANVVVFVAWGGVGKSALVNHWLRRMAEEHYRGAERVYGWSFYSQGTTDRVVSADLFIDSALRWFGDPDPTQGSPWDKGERLAGLVRQSRTLLVLDGLEPLQYPPGPYEGRLKDQAMQALLRELAAQHPGLCVVSTRLKVSNLEDFERSTAVRKDLEHLSPQAGAQILRILGIKGNDSELEQASREFGGHSLALTLLGSYLSDVCDGDVRRRNEIESLEEDVRHGGHARRVMASYEKWLSVGEDEGPELAVLRMLGLFDRPADAPAIAALRAAPAIPTLTEALQNLSETKWQQALSKLRRIRLLAERSANDHGTLDAHPLVREHFRQQLKRERPDAWREGNNRLYEHLVSTAKEFPDTVDEMSPLYAAVIHGCEAGRYQEALTKIYQQRILRDKKFFSTTKLGTIGADLAALSSFFDSPWYQLVVGLTKASEALILHQSGYALRAMGRLTEAAQPMKKSLETYCSLEDWEKATINAGQLNQLCLTIGDLSQALDYAKQSVNLANLSGKDFWRARQVATVAKTLHQMGQFIEAETTFREAEEIQKQNELHDLLYSQWGFMYCDLLLDQRRYQEVQTRAKKSLEWSTSETQIHEIALDHLSLGRALLLQGQQGGAGDFTQAEIHLNQAVDGLRQAGRLDHLPRGLIARSRLHQVRSDYERAQIDLNEAFTVATRGNMGLHKVDCQLEYARLYLVQDEPEQARAHWAEAKEKIEEMDYHRRDGEVAEIEARLNANGGG